jgi:hypothetical protein
VEEYKAPVWVPDDDAVNCMICDLEFRLYRRKHHCRLCGKVVCHPCSSRNFLIPGETAEEDRVERACDLCFHGRWGNADADDDEEKALADLLRSRTMNFIQSPGLAVRIGRVRALTRQRVYHFSNPQYLLYRCTPLMKRLVPSVAAYVERILPCFVGV